MARMTEDERTRRIATAAATVIVRDGIASTTTRRIAEEAGVPLGLIHYAFADKQDLFEAVYEHWMESTTTAGIDVVDAGIGLSAAARSLVDGLFAWACTDLNLVVGQYEMLLWANRSAPTLAATIYRRWIDLWWAALQRAAEPGTDADTVQDVLDQLLIAVDGAFIRLLSTRDVADTRRILDRALAHIENRLARHSPTATQA